MKKQQMDKSLKHFNFDEETITTLNQLFETAYPEEVVTIKELETKNQLPTAICQKRKTSLKR